MKINKLLIIILLANFSFAQQIVTAKLEPIIKNGLHQIVIPAEIRSFSNEDMSDFRIFDKKNVEVPYYVDSDYNSTFYPSFKEFKIISNTQIINKKTIVIIEIFDSNIINLAIEIANTNINKICNISGSNDQNQWFGLMSNEPFSDLKDNKAKSIIKQIALPKSDYKYLKFEFDDNKSLPINVLKIGYLKGFLAQEKDIEIIPKSKTITENKQLKTTTIHFAFEGYINIDKINFKVIAPRFYNKKCVFYTNEIEIFKHKQKVVRNDFLLFTLNSTSKNEIGMLLKTRFNKEFFVEIENNDDPPLTFKEIKLFQKPMLIVADLNENEDYKIVTGNRKLSYPNYGIQSFQKEISTNLPKAKIKNITIAKSLVPTLKPKSFYEKSWFMWLCIAFGGISILYFTANLIKDMKKNP